MIQPSDHPTSSSHTEREVRFGVSFGLPKPQAFSDLRCLAGVQVPNLNWCLDALFRISCNPHLSLLEIL